MGKNSVSRNKAERSATGGGGQTRGLINHRSPPLDNGQGDKDDMYVELWRACAGSLVYVPRVGEVVFYFLQGHIEQLEAYTDQDGKMEMPSYDLPYKILCKVVNVQLKAEARTDEVFAQVTLLPVVETNERSSGNDGSFQSSPEITQVRSFYKKLTRSDTSTHGGFSVPRRHADESLPPLDMNQLPPLQDLLAKDLHGCVWRFRHIFRGQPKRHLLTNGWSTFVTSKRLVPGDAFIFLRGQNGELRVGIRRGMKQQSNAVTNILSGPGMQHGVLASAYYAISTGTMFTVYYHPWTSPAGFIIPYDHYLKSAKIDYSVGTRFRMVFEGDECAEQRFEGTIVGADDIDPTKWPNSDWRSLKVKWDIKNNGYVRPEQVSPWDIEPVEPIQKDASLLRPPKRPRMLNLSLPALNSMFKDVTCSSSKSDNDAPQSHSEVLQGQEDVDRGVSEMDALKSPTKSYPASPPNVDSPHLPSQDWRVLELKHRNDVALAPTNGGTRYMLFGVHLQYNPPELPSPQDATVRQLESLRDVPPTSQSSVSEPSKSISDNQAKDWCFVSKQSYAKALKYGSKLQMSVDLMRFHGYDELIYELDKMFDFKGSLIDGSSGWHVTFAEKEGDMMLIRDIPWQKFKLDVQRIFICPKEN
ncbi:hypothetical protein K2173_004712 [Erythroxylum novogranatense]|uniref:Auxin response factor n=1 Tax=Erythroxylum novogranatense TaxID=1862640 RepID=A0AAV8UAY9_9ROSI|nr:hypothetical protein K2173_004712 [Erythroxylum novogranatense]